MHAILPYERCHTNGLNAPGRACVTCHGTHRAGQPHRLRQLPHHERLEPVEPFHHPATGMDGWQSMACTQCHPNGQFANVYCTCHGGNVPSGD